MSADAITWAISPPIVPAPTTAALNTNKVPPVPELRGRGAYLAVRLRLRLEHGQRPGQGGPHLGANEERVADLREEARGNELVCNLQGDGRLPSLTRERGRELSSGRRIGEPNPVPGERLVHEHLLRDLTPA